MTAKELFAVIVRAVGLILLVAGVVVLGNFLIEILTTPEPPKGAYQLDGYPPSYAGRIIVQSLFASGLGLFLLLGTKWIVRLVYGPEPPDSN